MTWNIVQNSWQYTSIYGADEHRICLLDLKDWGVTEDNQDELEKQQSDIAKLIAAAPALLEWLIKAAEELEATNATGHILENIKSVITSVYPEYEV